MKNFSNHILRGKKIHNKTTIAIFTALAFIISFAFISVNSGCNIYKFNEASIPDSIKTIKVNTIINKARYVNPQLSPQLTDKLRQKIINQTNLSPTNNDADWEINGEISDYSISTSGISNQQVATSRLNVSVIITKFNRKDNVTEDPITVTRTFDFAATLSLQAAETQLLDEMLRNLTDEIFNRLFSKW